MRPTREHATNTGQTYMVTSATWERRISLSQRTLGWAPDRYFVPLPRHGLSSTRIRHHARSFSHSSYAKDEPWRRPFDTSRGAFHIEPRKSLVRIWRSGRRGFRIIAFVTRGIICGTSITSDRIRSGRIFATEWKDVRIRRQPPVSKLDPVPRGLKRRSPEAGLERRALTGAPFQSKPAVAMTPV